jgi:hypothetical protein
MLAVSMRVLISIIVVAVVISFSGCSSTTVTQKDLQGRMMLSFPYVGSHFLYMGSKDGFDYVTHTWEDFRGSPGSRMFRVRTGGLRVGQQMAFTTDSTRWREIDI